MLSILPSEQGKKSHKAYYYNAKGINHYIIKDITGQLSNPHHNNLEEFRPPSAKTIGGREMRFVASILVRRHLKINDDLINIKSFGATAVVPEICIGTPNTILCARY